MPPKNFSILEESCAKLRNIKLILILNSLNLLHTYVWVPIYIRMMYDFKISKASSDTIFWRLFFQAENWNQTKNWVVITIWLQCRDRRQKRTKIMCNQILARFCCLGSVIQDSAKKLEHRENFSFSVVVRLVFFSSVLLLWLLKMLNFCFGRSWFRIHPNPDINWSRLWRF